MSRPSVGEGVLMALAAALVATILYTVSTLVLPRAVALYWVCVGLGLGYLLYLLGRAPEGAGRLVMVGGWMLSTGLVWSVFPGVWPQILTQLGMLWLIRSLYYHAGPLAALLDLGLMLFGLVAALWALERTGSLFLAVWTLLLVQAFFTSIPTYPERALRNGGDSDPFDHAERAAERALRRLSRHDRATTGRQP